MRTTLIIVLLLIGASSLVLGGSNGKNTDSIQNESSWEGTYTFDEVVPRGRGNSGNLSYGIVIYRRNNKLVADLDAEGWQTTERLKCEIKQEGNKIRS